MMSKRCHSVKVGPYPLRQGEVPINPEEIRHIVGQNAFKAWCDDTHL